MASRAVDGGEDDRHGIVVALPSTLGPVRERLACIQAMPQMHVVRSLLPISKLRHESATDLAMNEVAYTAQAV